MASMASALRRNPLRTAQIALAVLSVALSAAILGTAADALKVYNSQRKGMNPWWLPLWPNHFDTSSSPAIIAASSVALVLNLTFTAVNLFPRLSVVQSPKLAALFTMLIGVPSFILALFGVIFAHVLNTHSGRPVDRDTIQTWTCRFQNAKPSDSGLVVEKNMSNALFGKLCTESKFSFYGLIPLILLQFAMIVVAVIGWRRPVLTLPRSSSGRKELDSSPEPEGSPRGSSQKERGSVAVNAV